MHLMSDQNSLPHFLFLVSNALPHPSLPLISLHKNTSSNQDLHCKSWLELVFLRNEGRVVRYLQPKVKSVIRNFGQTLDNLHL